MKVVSQANLRSVEDQASQPSGTPLSVSDPSHRQVTESVDVTAQTARIIQQEFYRILLETLEKLKAPDPGIGQNQILVDYVKSLDLTQKAEHLSRQNDVFFQMIYDNLKNWTKPKP